MPVYLYRREDGTTFEFKQKFSDDPLTTDPDTGQKVVRLVQASGVIFKGSGFYINDSKGASKKSLNGSSNGKSAGNGQDGNETKSEASTSSDDSGSKDTVKAETKTEKKAESAATPSKSSD